jgi:molybdopterin-containing oxidoreductase family iron-sulfur binding subunit
MSVNKRDFLKASGLTLLGVTAGAGDALAQGHGEAPAGKPGTKRLAMLIDPSKCPEGCQDCLNACNLTHNIPKIDDPRHEIKWIWKEPFLNAFAVPHDEARYVSENYAPKQIPVLCNHCDNPPCVRVCPTKATFKRESDGIVMMDYHRCIGCRYCMAACPYGSRSFNYIDPRDHLPAEPASDFPTRTKGVVEKCNFCAERLAKGLKPACVDACKNAALFFGDINDPATDVSALLKGGFTIRRKPELGTLPMVYYIVRG